MALEASRHWALLPGWGMSSASLQPLATALSPDRVTLVRWPAQASAWRATLEGDWAPLRELLLEQVDAPALWLGWSLGGLVLGQLLRAAPSGFPATALIFLGCGPRFTRATDESWGLRKAELLAFSRAFHRDPSVTWRRFLSWQSSGEPQSEDCRRWLEEVVGDPTLSDPESLRVGLRLLGQIDFSPGLSAPPIPLLFLRGETDPLCPEWRDSPRQFSRENIQFQTIESAGHVPQWSEPHLLVEVLRQWLQRIDS